MTRFLVVLLLCLAAIALARPAVCDYARAIFDNLVLDTRLTDDFHDGTIPPSVWYPAVARVGYDLWNYAELPPPFVQASETGGRLILSGRGYQAYDYGRYLVSVQTFSGPCTLAVVVEGVCGRGSQWGPGLGLVKDDYTVQAFEDVRHWHDWLEADYQPRWLYGHSCVVGMPECDPHTIANSDMGSLVPISWPATARIIYDGGVGYKFQWIINGELIEGTYTAPESLGNYRVFFGLGVRLPGTEDSCMVDGGGDGELSAPGLSVWGVIVASLAIAAGAVFALKRKRAA